MQKAADWSAAPEEAARTSMWQGLGLPPASLAAPPVAAVMLGSPATLPSSSQLRRRATIATCPRAHVVPGARQPRQAIAVADLDGVGAGLPWPTIGDGVGHGGACS